MVVRATSASLAYLNAHSIVPIYLFLNKTRTYVSIYFFNFMHEKWWLAVRQLLSISLESSILFLPTSFYGLSFHKIFWACSISNHSTPKLAFHLVGEESILKEKPKLRLAAMHNELFLTQKVQFFKYYFLRQPQIASHDSNIRKKNGNCTFSTL